MLKRGFFNLHLWVFVKSAKDTLIFLNQIKKNKISVFIKAYLRFTVTK